MTTTAEAAGRRQAIWIAVAFAGIFLFQRIAVPGLPIPVTLPLTVLWLGLALLAHVIELDPTRTIIWATVSGFSVLLIIPQLLLVPNPLISVNSWALVVAMWFPLIFRFRDRSYQAFQSAMRSVSTVGVGISALSILFIVVQQLGVPYEDLLAKALPDALVMRGFMTTYPIFWGSSIYKANAWFALEASFLSFILGIAMVAALRSQRHPVLVAWIGLGILCTTAGSGILVVLVYLIVTILRREGRSLLRYLALGVPVLIAGSATALGDSILNRVDEVGVARSSTTLRAIEPYLHLVPRWLEELPLMLVGGGAGASQRVVEDLGITGLLVPLPAKMLYDYGLIGGILLLAMILVAFRKSPFPALAFALALSMMTLQGSAQPLVIMSLLVITMFAPSEAGLDHHKNRGTARLASGVRE